MIFGIGDLIQMTAVEALAKQALPRSIPSKGLRLQARIAKKPFQLVVHTPASHCTAAQRAANKRQRKADKRLEHRYNQMHGSFAWQRQAGAA